LLERILQHKLCVLYKVFFFISKYSKVAGSQKPSFKTL